MIRTGRMEGAHLRAALLVILCALVVGCATNGERDHSTSIPNQAHPLPPTVKEPPQREAHKTIIEPRTRDMSWKTRTISEDELSRLNLLDPSLTHSACCKLLARLNTKAHYYISEDIRSGRPLKVPNDMRSFTRWTPMPQSISGASGLERFILVIKDIPFLGWYERGRLMGDTYICVGKDGQWTNAGLFTVEDKDLNHYSRSYANSFGRPAWMPYAMRIYDTVWIHAGDITGPKCSHGCVTLPLMEAQVLFEWAETGTFVLILESLNDLHRDINKYSSLLRPGS